MKGSSTEAIYMRIVILEYVKRHPPIGNEVESLDEPRMKKEVLDYQQKFLLRVLAILVKFSFKGVSHPIVS